jgi:hypothetical protein
MNHRPARFRPYLEALEERSLLSVTFSFVGRPGGTQQVIIDASQSTAHNAIYIYNQGNGHITGYILGDPDGAGAFNSGAGFVNLSELDVRGGPGGTAVSYFQQGDQVYSPGFDLFTSFAGGENTLSANLSGHALRAGTLSFTVFRFGGDDAITINAANVNIAAGAGLSAWVNDSLAFPGGSTSFVMNWSGVKSGALKVLAEACPDANSTVAFGLDAIFLGAPPSRGTIPGRAASGAAPGDLAFYGGPGDNDLVMVLDSPSGLFRTGDVYGGPGQNVARRTANVNLHGMFQQDTLAP